MKLFTILELSELAFQDRWWKEMHGRASSSFSGMREAGKMARGRGFVRLHPTIALFDAAYFKLFKCSIKMIRCDYPGLLRPDVYSPSQQPAASHLNSYLATGDNKGNIPASLLCLRDPYF